MKIYTAAEMRRHEQAAADSGTSFLQLMENAGSAAAADLLHRFPQPGKALLVCGKGNNGGDALVMARLMQQQGWQADIVFVSGTQLSELAETNRQRLLGLPNIAFLDTNVFSGSLKNDYTVCIDGIFGTGFTGKLPENIAAACRRLNQSNAFRVALDIPTGLNGDTAEADADTFRADLTYTFAAYKPAHITPQGRACCGETVCLDIGID